MPIRVSKYAISFVQFVTVVRRSLEKVYNYGLIPLSRVDNNDLTGLLTST